MSLFRRFTTSQIEARYPTPPSADAKKSHKDKLAEAVAAEVDALEALEVEEARTKSAKPAKRSVPSSQTPASTTQAKDKKKKRETVMPAAEVSSTTMIVDDEPPSKITEVTAVAPPIPPRNSKMLGNQQKPPGIVFSACYDDSTVLGRILSKVESLSSEFTFLFTRAGLTITLLDTSHVTLLAVTVPVDSFLQYANLQSKPISFTVNSKAWCRFAKICQSDRTLTFMYDQCSLDSEPLHLMLFPADGKANSGQSSYRRMSPLNTDDGIVEPNSPYQYEVCVSARQFFKNVANLGMEDDTVRLRLSSTAFELAALTPGGDQIGFHSIPVADEPSDDCCTLKRIGDPASKVSLEQFANFRMSAVYLAQACAFGNNSECQWLTLRFGVTVGPGGICAEEPLYLRFPVRQGSPKGSFDVQLWVAPKLDENND